MQRARCSKTFTTMSDFKISQDDLENQDDLKAPAVMYSTIGLAKPIEVGGNRELPHGAALLSPVEVP